MGSRHLLVFVLACVSCSDSYVLGVREPNYWQVEDDPAAEPEKSHFWESTRRADVLQPSVDQLSWRYPQDPVDIVKETPVDFELAQPVKVELPQPATVERVAVRCGESRIQVEVSQDLLGSGELINPEDITLGGCPATELDSWSNVLVFDYELHNCGSTRVMTGDTLVYAFTLVYNPDVSGGVELPQPATVERVAVRCGESRIQVEVSQDLLGSGELINPEDITLGGCPATEVDSWSNVLVFDYELHNCGSTRVMTGDTLVYAFTLVYNPDVSGGVRITRSQSMEIGVECHYQR
uniref:ZP domain-containing protein n=1 Tax=Gasterosteus aculeatus aculeatus TaxID=481459 RepID=A0AAQ4NU00_GASAC